jgi:hypothetical protein
MRQKIVGTYRMGDDSVQLVLREGDGGDFYFQPGDIPYCRLKIGADVDEWWRVVAFVLHEAEEACIARICCRLSPDDEFGRDHATYVFLLRHEQFSDVCARAGMFLAACLPDLCKAWKQWHMGAKKRAGH